MDDNESVQPDVVLEGTPSPEAETKEQPQEQPFTEAQEARLQQMMADAKESGRREMQGIKDREVAEAQRRARLAESEAASYKTSFSGLDEDTKKDIELAQLRNQAQASQSLSQEDAQRQQQDAYFTSLNDSLIRHLDALGIDKDDKRIDWAKDAPDYLAGRSKFDASVVRILKEDAKVAESKRKQEFADMELKLRKDLGLESVDTSASPGVGGSDADFVEKIVSGELPITKENEERLKKIQKM